ncbi:hypothetical protein ACIQZM_13965 [Peribacillus sp. NPDC097206]|uniref:hypothetical protein n=1 Tax=unclassified Peribacillus TaxID=2675266 RepID=UPI00380F9463
MRSNKKQIRYVGVSSDTSLKTNSFLSNINKWIILFMCTWYSWPYFNYKLGVIPFLLILIIWFFTTDYRWVFQRIPLDLVMVIIWAITFLPYILTGGFLYGIVDGKYVMITFILFIGGIFINHYYMYYNNNDLVLGKVAFFSILFYVIASTQTYLGLKDYPLAARGLATGSDPLQQTYLSLGIGGFGFVYSAVFINILILYFVIKKVQDVNKFYKILCLFIYIIITTMLISASYATAILVLLTGTLLIVMIKGKKSFIFCMILVFLFLFLINPIEMIGYFLIESAKLFKTNEVISSKFLDLAQGFVSESVGSQTSGRGQLYLASLETFLRNPIFGIYGPFGHDFKSEVGGHSGWLDLMAYYGLFGSLPLFIAIFLNFRKQLRFYASHPYFHVLLTAQLLFVIFGFINPIIYIYQIGFVLFVVGPSIPYLPYAFSKKS